MHTIQDYGFWFFLHRKSTQSAVWVELMTLKVHKYLSTSDEKYFILHIIDISAAELEKHSSNFYYYTTNKTEKKWVLFETFYTSAV